LRKSNYVMPVFVNQEKAKSTALPSGCVICLWIAGTSGCARFSDESMDILFNCILFLLAICCLENFIHGELNNEST